MIPCTHFIPAYSELFTFLDHEGGDAAVLDFWNYLSDNYLDNLRELATTQGLLGCWQYWQQTLNEEAADFTMTVDEEAGEFRITMHRCPSKSRLLECPDIIPYPHYCSHCDTLYRRVLEPLGFHYQIDLSRCDEAACEVVVRTKPSI